MKESFIYFNHGNINHFLNEKKGAPLKKWGQNFLIDKNIVDIIIQSLPENLLCEITSIAEIGPGLGSITHRLAEFNKPVYLFEIDPILIDNLKDNNYNTPPFILIEGDVLKNLNILKNESFFCFGNLPYYISTDILTSLVQLCPNLKAGIFMLQKEFINRITSENSSISVFLSVFGVWRHVKNVSSSCFYPSPKAESSLIYYEKHSNRVLSDPEIDVLQIILRSFFWGKRKTIQKNIKDSPFLNKYNRTEIHEAVLQIDNLTGQERAEDIKKETYYRIAKIINSTCEKIN
jgi:16S rRNA (adenine1518-N6/adenine1519-N6)-dimethyltransferase